MKQITAIIILQVAASLCVKDPAGMPEHGRATGQLNVLMIMADDLSTVFWDKERDQIHTPNLDELALQGRSFKRAYCQASLFNPSRASVMTGRYPHELGIWTNQPHFRGIFPRIRTLPQLFKENGYHSVGIGKISHNWGQSLEGDAESWSESQIYHWAAHYHDWYVPGRPYQWHFDLRKGPAVQKEDVPGIEYVDSDEASSYTDVPDSGPIPEEKRLELRHAYYAAISYLDAQVGKVIGELKKLGLDKRTVIVFISDHGYHAGEHGHFGKWTNLEIGTRVPMIIACPGITKAGVPAQGIVESVDIYPALLEICGIPSPECRDQLSGISLASMLIDPDAMAKETAISQITRPMGANADFTILGSTIRTSRGMNPARVLAAPSS
jgi:arylsulfatase A-like enzyme